MIDIILYTGSLIFNACTASRYVVGALVCSCVVFLDARRSITFACTSYLRVLTYVSPCCQRTYGFTRTCARVSRPRVLRLIFFFVLVSTLAGVGSMRAAARCGACRDWMMSCLCFMFDHSRHPPTRSCSIIVAARTRTRRYAIKQ